MDADMTPRLNGLTIAELTKIGDPDALRTAIDSELDGLVALITKGGSRQYTDDDVHQLIDARLAALPETGTERTAIQRTYELYLAVIDAGVSDTRTGDELLHWIDGFRPEKAPE